MSSPKHSGLIKLIKIAAEYQNKLFQGHFMAIPENATHQKKKKV